MIIMITRLALVIHIDHVTVLYEYLGLSETRLKSYLKGLKVKQLLYNVLAINLIIEFYIVLLCN